MSNALMLAQQQVTGAMFVLLAIATIVALTIAHAAGVFSRSSMQSPDRIGSDERPSTLMLIFLTGLVTWIFIPALYLAANRGPAATQPQAIVLSPRDQVVISAVGALTALVVLIIGNQTFREQGLQRLGLGWQRLWPAIPQGIVGILLVMPVLTWVSILTMVVWRLLGLEHPEKHELLEILDKTPDPMLAGLLIVTAVVIAPVYEELLFRGHLQSLLRHFIRRPWVAILLSSAVFAVVHPLWTWPPIFFLSVCLGYAYERSGNLWLPVMIHALFNGTSVLLSSYMQ